MAGVFLLMVGAIGWHDAAAGTLRNAEPGTLLLGVALAEGVSDRLSVGDIRPEPHGEWAGRVSLDYRFTERWAATFAGQIGGSWLDFNGFVVSGKIVEASWTCRAGVDRLIPTSHGALLFVGIGLEYGEARSWLDNLVISQQGPHNYAAGASTRIGIASPFMGRVQAYGELLQSFYRGHARDGVSGIKYNWLGRSLSGAVGVRFALVRGQSHHPCADDPGWQERGGGGP